VNERHNAFNIHLRLAHAGSHDSPWPLGSRRTKRPAASSREFSQGSFNISGLSQCQSHRIGPGIFGSDSSIRFRCQCLIRGCAPSEGGLVVRNQSPGDILSAGSIVRDSHGGNGQGKRKRTGEQCNRWYIPTMNTTHHGAGLLTDPETSTFDPSKLPIHPAITPALSVAGAYLIISGALYTLIGIKTKWYHGLPWNGVPTNEV
jgi:hypothetical protein